MAPLQLKIDSADIDRVKDFNFLGLVVNENLNWKSHTEKVSNSMSKTIGILNRLKYFVPLENKNHFIKLINLVSYKLLPVDLGI